MEYLFGPMEGITTSTFRAVHSALFPGCGQYYTPFISPTVDHILTAREHREVDPDRNRGVNVIPQLLTKNARDFLWAAELLAEMGYTEVNLNLGCPSATVTAKGKGAGLLRTPDALDAFLEEVYASAPLPVSIKTRIGYESAGEFSRLLEIYNRYPVRELCVHVRTRQEMYKVGTVHPEAFAYALRESRNPVVYNGDLFTPGDCAAFSAAWPGQERVMLARGAAADPALFRELRGGAAATREELREFHRTLTEAYRRDLGALNGMRRMKELWRCMLGLFEGGEALGSKLGRIQDPLRLEDFVDRVLRELPRKNES